MLTNDQMKVGRILRVLAYRGQAEEFVGDVVEVRDVHAQPVAGRSRRARVVTRSQFLVFLRHTTGTGEENVRSFYHAFAEGEVVG